jgi:hypothetical protein
MDRRKILIRVSVVVVVLLLLGGGFVFLKNCFGLFVKQSQQAISEKKTPVAQNPADDYLVQKQAAGSAVDNQALVSENYQMQQINFGGETSLAYDASEKLPIEINSVRTETFTNSKGDASQASITWKSNKLTISEVEYSKTVEKNTKIFSEKDFGFGHSAILAGLEPGTAYVYRINSTDHWGNKITSDYFGFYTSAKATSVFELIGQKMREIFGWAIK